MFIEPRSQRSLKLPRSGTLDCSKIDCAPPELKKSYGDGSYKHLAALRQEH
ncbi:MAG: hypothetical protein QOH70_1727 [Blastocatellia bacterium]|nr:hypothetical protein [Blastocatellia bacterium]